MRRAANFKHLRRREWHATRTYRITGSYRRHYHENQADAQNVKRRKIATNLVLYRQSPLLLSGEPTGNCGRRPILRRRGRYVVDAAEALSKMDKVADAGYEAATTGFHAGHRIAR